MGQKQSALMKRALSSCLYRARCSPVFVQKHAFDQRGPGDRVCARAAEGDLGPLLPARRGQAVAHALSEVLRV